MDTQAFQPLSDSVPLQMDSSQSPVTVALPSTVGGINARQLRVYNGCTSVIYIKTWKASNGAPTLDNTGTFVAPGATECFRVIGGADTLGVYLAPNDDATQSTGWVLFQRGVGI